MKKLLKGYDWLCKCGESNYDDETECMGCGAKRSGNEADYRAADFVNGNDEESEEESKP